MTTLIDVIIVEDEELLLGVYKGLLSTFTDYSFLVTDSGENLEILLQDYSFKVAIIDLMLENSIFNGIEIADLLRKKCPGIVLYAMTGLYCVFDDFDPSVAGFEACFSKPLEFEALFNAIAKTLGKDNYYSKK